MSEITPNCGAEAWDEPAFPRPATKLDSGDIGMTLRDYFAAQVLPQVYETAVDLGNDDQASIASECYELANAMMQAREAVPA